MFDQKIESKFLGVPRNNGRDGYDNYYTIKLGGNPHTIQLFLLESQGDILTQKKMTI
jgi:hypothetical protein